MPWRARLKKCKFSSARCNVCLNFLSDGILLNSVAHYFVFNFMKCCYARDETIMTSHQMQSLIEYLPSSEEKHALNHFLKSNTVEERDKKMATLCECEKFMVAMSHVKDLERKIRCLVFRLSFDSNLSEVKQGTSTM